MLWFLVGTAVIVLPRGNLTLLGLAAAVKAARAINRRLRRKARRAALENEFAPENGNGNGDKVEPVTLEWSKLTCKIVDSKGNEKVVLKGVSGVAKPGRLLCIMGPSGSGKTTLLNALAGQVPRSSRLQLTGEVLVNGVPSTLANHKQAYVQQQDIFYSQLTTSETLHMAAQLSMPEAATEERRQEAVEHLMGVLGLAGCKDTVVGDNKTRGLSGGEKKRLSLGCELIRSPSLVFLDEPTTGLDAFQAEKVMQTLKDLAQAGHTVVAVVHQPRSSIFELFDDLALISNGDLLYFGAAEKVLDHMRSQGHVCPEHYNPAEFVADLISIDYTSPEGDAGSRKRLQDLAAAWAKQAGGVPNSASMRSGDWRPPRPPTSVRLGRQFKLLLVRSWRQITRDRATAIARAIANVSSALIFGAIYFRMRRKQSTVQDRLGMLQVAAINTAMSSIVKTLNVFPNERTIVSRERAKGAYQVLPYLTAKLVAELPISALFPLLFGAVVHPLTGLNPNPIRFAKFLGILTLESFTSAALGLTVGSFAPSTEAAAAIGPAIMVVWIVFGGYYVNAENVPWALRWLPQASLIKQGFQALCINEFTGMELEQDQPGALASGEEVLKWLKFQDSTLTSVLLKQSRILLAYYWLTYHILKANKPSFQTLEPPCRVEEEGEADAAPAPKAAAASR